MKLPYKADQNFTLALLLPRTIHGVPDLINRLKNAEEVLEAFNALQLQEVDIYLPKFNVTVANLLKVPAINVSLLKWYLLTTQDSN